MKSEIKSILNVASANFLVMFIGIGQTLVLPNILEPIEYGYWSLYLLYVGYAGFTIFGFCDGFYLKYGGKKYDELDKRTFSSYHLVLLSYLLILLIIWCLGVGILLPNSKRSIVLICVGIGGVLACQNSYFILLNQATARFSIYAKGNMLEKIIIITVALICIFVPGISCFYIIVAALVGKLITTIYFTYYSREIVFAKPIFNATVWSSILENIGIGFTLTLSNIGATLITGFGRFVIESKLGVEELGYYSLMFSVSALFTQLIYAISTVFYPIFRRVSESKAKLLLDKFDKLIVNLGGSILILYYPARFFLELLFPKYHPAMECILFLFPIVICQGRMTIVYSTIFKVLRMERQLLKNVIFALVFCVVITLGLFYIYPNKETIALATYISFLFWSAITVWRYNKIGSKKIKVLSADAIISGIYIAINYAFGYSWKSFTVTFAVVFIYTVLKGKQIISIVKDFRAMM